MRDLALLSSYVPVVVDHVLLFLLIDDVITLFTLESVSFVN